MQMRKIYAKDLTVRQIHYLLLEKRRTTRHRRLDRFHRTGRVVPQVGETDSLDFMVRTPLTATRCSMEGLIDGILPSTQETYEQIHAEADRLNRLVDDLQELSRVEARAYELNLQPLDIAMLVRTVAKRLAHQVELKNVSLVLDLPGNLPPALADPDRAIQILTNLTGNAVQYTPEGGRISISAQDSQSEIMLSVQDTGIGIPAEHVSHVFDRFYRVDKSRSRRAGGGSGIGLTIARALVEGHGGRIWVESTGEGQGSTFKFTLKKAV